MRKKVRAVTVAVRDDENKSRLFIIDERRTKRASERANGKARARSLFSSDERLVENSPRAACTPRSLHPRCSGEPGARAWRRMSTRKSAHTSGERTGPMAGECFANKPCAVGFIFPVKRGARVPDPSRVNTARALVHRSRNSTCILFSRPGNRAKEHVDDVWMCIARSPSLSLSHPERPRINSALADT